MTRPSLRQLALLVVVAGASALLTWMLTRPEPAAPPPMEALALTFEHDVIDTALAPDGTALVYTAVAEGQTWLFVRRIARRAVTRLAGTENASQPFFSPDGERVGFFADGYLKWTVIDGGAPVTVTPVGGRTAGGSWTPDDRIVFAPLDGRGLQVVAVTSGAPATTSTQLTELDPQIGEVSHGWPHVLPDGRSIIFTVGRSERDPRLAWMALRTEEDRGQVQDQVQDKVKDQVEDQIKDQDELVLLAAADGGGFYLDTGHVLYSRRGEVFVVPVDSERREVTAPAQVLEDGVSGSAEGYRRLGRSSLVAARDGRMVYAERSRGPANNMLVWVDRQGASADVDSVAAQHQSPRISPDGSRIAMTIRSGLFSRDLWIQDAESGQRRKLTADEGDNHSTVWSRDGTRITFASSREGPQRIYRMTLTDPPVSETLVFGDGRTPGSWAPDGRSLFFHESYPDRGRDIWVWTIDASGTGTGSLLLATAGNERTPAISPDGRWLAYVSDSEDGDQVYLRRYPGDVGTRVSLTGGSEPVWSRDGAELFYRRGRDLFSVAVPEDSDTPGQPRHLFAGRFLSDPGGNVPSYDVDPAGSRFLMLRPIERATTLQVLSHWISEIVTEEP